MWTSETFVTYFYNIQASAHLKAINGPIKLQLLVPAEASLDHMNSFEMSSKRTNTRESVFVVLSAFD